MSQPPVFLGAPTDEFAVYLDRDDYRGGMPAPISTKVHKVGPTPQVWQSSRDGVDTITLIGYSAIALTGTRAQLREALDQLELAYDRLENPPAATNPWTQGHPAAWTGD